MERHTKNLSRRDLLVCGSWLTLGAAIAGLPSYSLAEDLAVLDVAYAGSMGSLMEGPIKQAVAQSLKVDFHGRAQGSSALAQLIAGGSIRTDVFIPVTPGPMLTVLRAGMAESAQPIAHTEMVIAYSPKSRFASKLDAAAQGKGNWWEVLQEPGLRFGRTDPIADPQGRNIIFTMMLAAKAYKQPDLVDKVLGPTINERQIFTEPTVEARLQSGELDAASAYKIQPGPFNLPYISLPKEINLSGQNVHAENLDVTLTVGGKTFTPEPLIYYAAVLKNAANSKGAAAFAEHIPPLLLRSAGRGLSASRMRIHRRWITRLGAALFAIALLYPFTALLAHVGPWRWDPLVRNPAVASIRVSLLLTGCAMAIIVAIGTPVAAYITHCRPHERLLWQAVLLIPILLPPLALGILMTLAFGSYGAVGALLERYGIVMTNSATAFVTTQVYVGMGYYVLGAVAALDAVPVMLQKQAALLGLTPMRVFLRVTLPLSRLGLAVSLSIAWVRAIGEFGAVVVTAYYPSGMPVQLWVNLQSFGLPAVMPLLVVFLAAALPLPWLIHVLAQRQRHA